MNNKETHLKPSLIKTKNAIRNKYKKLHASQLVTLEMLSSTDKLSSKHKNNVENGEKKVRFDFSTPKVSVSRKKLFSDETESFSDYHTIKENGDNENEDIGEQENNSQFSLNNLSTTRSEVSFDNSDIIISGSQYKFSKWLFDLLFRAQPDNNYTEVDLQHYKKILLQSNAHKINYDLNGKLRNTNTKKYINIVKPLFIRGSGLLDFMKVNQNKTDYKYWDNPNELINRLRLIISSKKAGHTGHDNEIISIIEELREANLII